MKFLSRLTEEASIESPQFLRNDIINMMQH